MDHCMVSFCIAHPIEAEMAFDGPWAPHFASIVTICSRPSVYRANDLKTFRPLPLTEAKVAQNDLTLEQVDQPITKLNRTYTHTHTHKSKKQDMLFRALPEKV